MSRLRKLAAPGGMIVVDYLVGQPALTVIVARGLMGAVIGLVGIWIDRVNGPGALRERCSL